VRLAAQAGVAVGVYDRSVSSFPRPDPEREAEQLLSTVWEGRPIPVDPIQIAKRLGIQVYTAGLDEGVAGMLVKKPGRDPEIYINGRDSLNRQRFTCAHELGHYVKHIAAGEEHWEHVDYRDALTSKGTDPDEIFANQFAASLLMPEQEIRRLKDQFGYGPATLAFEFGVSEEAINFRLVNLKLT
jgi:Zn-dependent peptidase ImmA (M78 family)